VQRAPAGALPPDLVPVCAQAGLQHAADGLVVLYYEQPGHQRSLVVGDADPVSGIRCYNTVCHSQGSPSAADGEAHPAAVRGPDLDVGDP
jgi:hypothetical protein